jgi:hypothetical protein
LRVAAIQSSFIPWRGYFDFIASVDCFVVLDDVQYTTRDWRNRNKIKTPKGVEWLSVPVLHKERSQLVLETKIDYGTSWWKKHMGTWSANYRAAPYFDLIMEILSGSIEDEVTTISQLNIKLMRKICEYLGISTPMMLSTELTLEGSKTERLIDLLGKLNASAYLSGPSADAYLDKEAFRRSGIRLEYKSYDYAPYPQLWGNFAGEVTVLDLIANCGPGAKNYIRSRTPDTVVVRGISS